MTFPDLIREYIEHPDQKALADNPATSLAEVRIQHDALIGMALEIEDAFAISLSDNTIHGWATIGDIQDTVDAKLRRKRAMDQLVAGDGELVA